MDITGLLAASRQHIQLWQTQLGQLTHSHPQGSGALPTVRRLRDTWDTLAILIEWHMDAEDEICRIPEPGTPPQGPVQAAGAAERHEIIRNAIRAARLQPPGSPAWRDITADVVTLWAGEAAGHHALLDRLRGLSPARRQQLARQWRAYMEARTRDEMPGCPDDVPACHLSRDRPAAAIPHAAAPSFAPLYCTCAQCDAVLQHRPATASGVRP